jgi:hypothetical protein
MYFSFYSPSHPIRNSPFQDDQAFGNQNLAVRYQYGIDSRSCTHVYMSAKNMSGLKETVDILVE